MWIAFESQSDILEIELRGVVSEQVTTVVGLEPGEVGGVGEFVAQRGGAELAFEDVDRVKEGDGSTLAVAIYYLGADLQVSHVVLRVLNIYGGLVSYS